VAAQDMSWHRLYFLPVSATPPRRKAAGSTCASSSSHTFLFPSHLFCCTLGAQSARVVMSDGDVHDTGTLDFVDLELDPGGASPCILAAQFIPSRALMLFQARARLANGRQVHVFWAPTTSDAVRALNGGPTDVMGKASFSFGAAILAPSLTASAASTLSSTEPLKLTWVDGAFGSRPMAAGKL
jgi:hypothetical protein